MSRVHAFVLSSAVALVLSAGHGFAQSSHLQPLPWTSADRPVNTVAPPPSAGAVTNDPAATGAVPDGGTAAVGENSETTPIAPARDPAIAQADTSAPADETETAPATKPVTMPVKKATAPSDAKSPAAEKPTAARTPAPAQAATAGRQAPPLPEKKEEAVQAAAQAQAGPLRRFWQRVVSGVNTPPSSTSPKPGDVDAIFRPENID